LNIIKQNEPRFHSKADKIQFFLDAYSSKDRLKKVQGEEDAALKKPSVLEVGTFRQFGYLLKRSATETFRNRTVMKSKLAVALILGGVYSILYAGLDFSRKGVQNRDGFLFIAMLTMLSSGILQVVLTFPLQRAVFLKEQAVCMYGSFVYFWAKTIPEIFMEALSPTVFCFLTYWILGLNTDSYEKPLIFWGICVLNHMGGGSVGFLLGSALSNIQGISEFLNVVLMPCVTYAGFMANFDSIPIPFRYLTYANPFRYGFSALVLNEYEGLSFECEDDEIDPCSPVSDLSVEQTLWQNILILLAHVLAMRVTASILLKLKVKSQLL